MDKTHLVLLSHQHVLVSSDEGREGRERERKYRRQKRERKVEGKERRERDRGGQRVVSRKGKRG